MKPVILIVDDDPDTLSMLERFATSEGFSPELAANGNQALTLLDSVSPDLILLDAVMPGADGFAVCRLIKARENAADIPVIFMTGLSDTEHVVMGLEAGGVDYVSKPIVLDELAARIRVHLANAHKARSALTGLESMGALLFTCNNAGAIGWTTPEAQKLIERLEPETLAALRTQVQDNIASSPGSTATFGDDGSRFSLAHLGDAGGGDHLFRLDRSSEGNETILLQAAFGLTPREAEVLLWTARGKSNKDMSEILNISARTVNKHLEQVFIKVGVENRASAASAATRVLFQP
ncbi:DNA-binding response regulator [Croceicoccus estronivorus]|uniref:response regulator n=1 Tax=Croceicoccus estronivorus TaxID=1172626 RepID=UPI000836BB3E|nr:response regulator [Croceicoccus estronivorus]OCC22387.1 DNA-binding response regulator [Croceicoccus estronivorus]